jgi:hypothetical protein
VNSTSAVADYCGDPECDECVPPAPPAKPEPKTFWLIERGANQRQSPTVWWSSRPDAVSSYSWVESVHKATHFDSAEAAEAVAQKRYLRQYAVTSHNFIDGVEASDKSVTEGRDDKPNR